MFEAFNSRNLTYFTNIIDRLKQVGELDYIKYENKTILETICYRCEPGDEHFLEKILRRGANPNMLTSDKYHILSLIANNQYKNIIMFELLLTYGANVDYCKEPGQHLHNMCINGDTYNSIPAISLAIKFGAKKCYMLKHNSLGNMSTIQVCQMLISPNHAAYGFRSSCNHGITQTIINMLNGYSYVPLSYSTIRADKLASVASERAIEIKNKKDKQDKILEIERDRLAQIERDRLAQIEHDRLAQIESDRLAQIELLRIENNNISMIEQHGLSFLALAVSNLEYLFHNGTTIPENLKNIISDMTTQLLIKAGQNISLKTLDTLCIPDEYKHLIESSDTIIPFWE
jgi:ankyrin repeat protein